MWRLCDLCLSWAFDARLEPFEKHDPRLILARTVTLWPNGEPEARAPHEGRQRSMDSSPSKGDHRALAGEARTARADLSAEALRRLSALSATHLRQSLATRESYEGEPAVNKERIHKGRLH